MNSVCSLNTHLSTCFLRKNLCSPKIVKKVHLRMCLKYHFEHVSSRNVSSSVSHTESARTRSDFARSSKLILWHRNVLFRCQRCSTKTLGLKRFFQSNSLENLTIFSLKRSDRIPSGEDRRHSSTHLEVLWVCEPLQYGNRQKQNCEKLNLDLRSYSSFQFYCNKTATHGWQ